MSFDRQQDLEDLAAWRDGKEVNDPTGLERRLIGRLADVPSDLHYSLLDLIGDGATSSQVVPDSELYNALSILAQSKNPAASVRASALLFRDFEDARYLDRIQHALSNTENPGFFDALFALREAAAAGRGDAKTVLDRALNDDAVETNAKEAIAAAIARSRRH
jgi:hypothetical protein